MLSFQASFYAPAGTNELNAPWNQPDDDRRSHECAICKAVGYEFEGTFEDEDEDPMDEAQIAPTSDFVCSNRCLSQLMFQSASPDLQYQLKRYERAVTVLQESSSDLKAMLETWGMCENFVDAVNASDEVRSELAAEELPAWINENEDPEDALRRAIRSAIGHLQWHPVVSARATIQLEIELAAKGKGNQYEAGRAATSLAAVGQALISLQQALDGEVR
jgi:hypothetical protein